MRALVMQINESLETNIALVYKSVFLGETATILKEMGIEVEVCDATIEGYSLNDLILKFCTYPELIILVVDVQQSRIAKRVADYCKLCSSKSKILIIGRATAFLPQYFTRSPFDAVHIKGDREAAIISYVKYLKGEIKKEDITNLALVMDTEIYFEKM